MEVSFFSWGNFQLALTFYVVLGAIAVQVVGAKLLRLVPEFRELQDLNNVAMEDRRKRWPGYDAVQKHGLLWAIPFNLLFYFTILPFFVTADQQPWWNILLDIVVVLMVYDFVYYLTHRFIFHDGGPLVWMHAVHHRQKNPCRKDSSYIHPLEAVIGIGLFVISYAITGLVLGDLHWIAMLVSMVGFQVINTHNHALMESNYFPFKYLHYASRMHHVHHSRFSSGNFATITLLYDWLFGTYDTGEGWGKNKKVRVEEDTEAATSR